MTEPEKKEPTTIPTDLILQRVERYGLATFLLLAIMWWAKPHADKIFDEHSEFLKKTSTTNEKLADVISRNSDRLQRIESSTTDSEKMVRDIHGRILHADVPSPPAPTVADK